MTDNIRPNLEGLPSIKFEDQNGALASCILDTATGIGVDNNTSHAAIFSPMFQVNTVPTGTVVSVQAKIHKDAEWIEIWRSSDADQHFLQTYQMPYNFQRAVRISGTGDVKAFASVMPTDFMG